MTEKIDLDLHAAYDHMALHEDTVILEWDWPYWDERYIDWLLTGATGEEVDSISTELEYWRPDSSYHGIFHPSQWLNELRFGAGASFLFPLKWNWTLYGNVGGGISIFRRRLKVVEDWTKIFTWEWDSLEVHNGELTEEEMNNYQLFNELHNSDPQVYQLDTLNSVYRLRYDYQTTITHFAPDKKGFRVYLTPSVGVRYFLKKGLSLDLSYQGIWYMNIGDGETRESFPVRSKSMLWLGLEFSY
ncbi:MAG: hypothetical protein U5N56_08535 [Candidatus Marinimicrobia bacterium]|nr:hypothetical protein [Candidatus Neomarinimicrobiota bacterium]